MNAGGGFTDLNSREYLIRNIGRTTNLDDLRNMVIGKVDGRPVFLHQVATVEFAARTKRGDSGYMGTPAVLVSVEKQPNVDTVTLTRNIEQALKELNAGLPLNIKADNLVFGQANFIETSVRNVQTRAAGGVCRRRSDPVLVPYELADDGDFPDGDPDLDPYHGGGVLLRRPFDQHHDAWRHCDCDRRTGR